MNSTNQNRTLGIGIFIILLGLVFLLNQLNLIPFWAADVIFSWPMIIIAIGAYNLLFTQSRTFGFILLTVGGFFILPEIFDLPYNFRKSFWPVLLILVGLFIIFRSGLIRKQGEFEIPEDGNMDYIDEINIFSGSEKKMAIKNFRGGKLTSIFGGSEIDLTGSELADGNNVIEVFCLFGGSSFILPADWSVTNKVTSILGGFSEKGTIIATDTATNTKTLTITGFVMFGGGEIKRR